MKLKILLKLLPALGITLMLGGLLAGFLVSGAAAQGPINAQADVGTAFSYQGRLEDAGGPVNSSCDFSFKLYDQVSNGIQVGSTVNKSSVPVSNGYFTVELDFGDNFKGAARYLEIGVNCGGGLTTLSPRVALNATPYALHAKDAWVLGGNSGTTPGIDVLGTTDAATLTLIVSDKVAMRFIPIPGGSYATAPNIIGGSEGNVIGPDVTAAVIGGGGGNPPYWNRITDNSGTIGGGRGNLAGNDDMDVANATYATVSGGIQNEASGKYATVGGGWSNQALSDTTTIGGGHVNETIAPYATVGGGYSNIASGDSATVAGGYDNEASGASSTIAGGEFNDANGVLATVGGGSNNTTSGQFATVGGGHNNTISGERATIGGGDNNTASGYRATVAGGSGNTASNVNTTIGGGGGNQALSDTTTIGGGFSNTASGEYATVGGGYDNTASGDIATVSGGYNNTASGYRATVAGGSGNTASGNYSFAAGEQAKANHSGAFVWADNTYTDFTSDRDNQFKVRAGGGMYLEVSDASGLGPAALHIESTSSNGVALFARQTSSDATLVVTNQGSGDLIKAFGTSNAGNLRFRVTQAGDVRADGNYYGAGYNAGSADFAEMVLPGQTDLVPGDVLAIGSNGRMVRSNEAYQASVVGVYSTEPGFVGGYKLDEAGNPLEPERIPLAVVGIVPVKASAENGAIQPGDLLVASDSPGYAMRAEFNPPTGSVIGKALEGLESGTGLIEMLVILQ